MNPYRFDVVEITTFGSPVSQYLHVGTGYYFEDWCSWEWGIDWSFPKPPSEYPR